MSTLSGVSSKGEKSKGKSSFQSLKINSLYKGESTEGNHQKSIVPRKNGLQPLGKVIRNVRNPVNLPSEKSESSHESTINLVPIGGAGWGNKQATEKSLVGAGKEAPPTSTATTTPQLSQSGPVPGQQHVSSHPTAVQVTTTTTRPSHVDGKTWAKKIVDIPVVPNYLAHRSMQFQQEFPSLTSSGEHKNAVNINTPIQSNTEQRPSLRPQTETSWMQGGSRPQMPLGVGGVTGIPGQILHSQTSLGSENVNGVRSNLVQNGVAGAQVGLNPYQMHYNMTKNPVMRNMLPNFMVSNQSDNVVHHHKHHAYPPEKMFQHISSSMANDCTLNKPSSDIKELIPPPIIREEDLKRMNELSKEAGWSIQGEIDYNKKLDFSDDEDQSHEKSNKQSLNGDIRSKSDNAKTYFGNKVANCDPNFVQNLKEGMFVPMNINGIPFTTEFMHYYRPSSNQDERQVDDDYDDESLGRARVNEELNAVLQRAKDRKLEEMRRFEMQQQLEATKYKKNDGENNDNKNKEFITDSSKSRSELLKDKNDDNNDNKEINTKYLPQRLHKQFEQNSDTTNKVQNITKGIRTLSRTDSDMSSSGYSEYRSDSLIEDDNTNKSSSLKRDKRSEFDRYKREKCRSDLKDKNDKYAHTDYSSRTDDNRKTYDHKRDFKRNESGSNGKKSSDESYETDKNDKKESYIKVSKYHSRDSLETQEEIEKDNLQVDDESYSWGQKSLSKDFYKDDISSSSQFMSKKYIPGPITQEKLEACELTSEPKRNLNQLVKSERKDPKKNDQNDDLSTKAKSGVWDLAPTAKNKMFQEQNHSKLEQDIKSGKSGQKTEDDIKLSEPKSSLENNSGTSTSSHHKGMRSDRNVGSRSYQQSINSRTVSRSGSNRKTAWPDSYEDSQRSRGPPRRDDRNRGEDRNRNEDRNRDDRNRNDDRNREDRNRNDERNRNDDRNRGSNRQNDRYSEKSTLRGYGQRSEQRGRGRLGNIESRVINGRSGQKNSVDDSIEKNKTSQNSGSNRTKTSSSKTQSKMDSYVMSGDSNRRSGENRFGSRQSNRSLNTQKQEDNWESVSEPSDYEAQQKNSNRRHNSHTYMPSSSRGDKKSNYDKKDQPKESSGNEKSNQKLASSTSFNGSKNSYGGNSSQDGRSSKKDDQRKSNDSQQKNLRLTNLSNRKDQAKSSSRSNQNSNVAAKPGQTNQRYERQKSQSQIGQDDSNAPIIKDAVIMVSSNPPPPPQTNAWDKPITHALRAQSPNVNKPVAVPQSNNRANSLTEIREIPAQASQRLTSNKEKGSPNVMENGILDATQRMETIIFENTTYKSKPCGESKNKYNSNIKQRSDKDTCNFNEETQDTCFRAFKSSNSDGNDTKLNEAVQMSMSFKNDESSDLNLGFGDFESDFTRSGGHLSAENKDVMALPSHSRSIHTGPSSLAASDLKTMIAGTKKVWDDKPESNQQVQQNIAESSFNTVYSTANSGQHDKTEISVIDDQRVHNQQVYSPAPQLQNVAGSYIPVSMATAGQLKQDPNAATTNVCKVKPQPQGTLSPPLSQQQQQSSTSNHVFSSTTPQPHTSTTPLANTIPTQATHMNLQIMMENSEGLPDMYGAHILKQQQTHLILNTNNKTGVEMLAKQQYVSAAPGPSPSSTILFNSAQQHLLPPPSPSAPQVYQTMIEPSQVISNATRSQFNQFTYGLQSNGLSQNSPQYTPSMYIHTNTPPGQGGSEVFQSPFRIGPGPAYNNGQQINTNLNPVLIPSSTNSSSSQVKQSSQQIGTIGNKTTYNATTPQPSPYMVPYDPTTMFNQPYNSINNPRATPLQSTSSLYSTNSGTGPTNPGFIPNVASAFQAQVVAGASGSNTYGIPTAFGSQSAPPPPPNLQNYTSQYRQIPYMKGNLGGGNGTNDLQKSGISNQQDLGNPMFSSNLFRQQFFETNKPLINSNQQSHQAMQGKYSNYQVSASQNNQLPLMQQQPRMNMNNSNNGTMAANIAPQQYPPPIQRPVSSFQHLQRMPPPQNMRMQPNCAPIQHLMNKSQNSNNYFVSNPGLIVEPPLPLPNKIDSSNVNVDSKAEEKIDSSSKPQNTECKDDKPLAVNE